MIMSQKGDSWHHSVTFPASFALISFRRQHGGEIQFCSLINCYLNFWSYFLLILLFFCRECFFILLAFFNYFFSPHLKEKKKMCLPLIFLFIKLMCLTKQLKVKFVGFLIQTGCCDPGEDNSK